MSTINQTQFGVDCQLWQPLSYSAVSSLPPYDDFTSSDLSSSDDTVGDSLSNSLTTPLVPISIDLNSTNTSSNDSSLYQHRCRPYTNGHFDRYAPKSYSPHDSIESYHQWANREYKILTCINSRAGTVSLVLRFHCCLSKHDYAALMSQLRKELKRLEAEWICIGDITTRADGPINRLHFHFSFDTELSPDVFGVLFRAACERALYRMVRRSDFKTDAEYQATIKRRYRKHKTVRLQYRRDYTITDKRYITDNGGSWPRFVRYALKCRYSPYGVDPVPNYYTEGNAKDGMPLIRLFTKYKRGSGTKSLQRMYYSKGWFVNGTHQQLIRRYHRNRRASWLSFNRSTTESIESQSMKEGGLKMMRQLTRTETFCLYRVADSPNEMGQYPLVPFADETFNQEFDGDSIENALDELVNVLFVGGGEWFEIDPDSRYDYPCTFERGSIHIRSDGAGIVIPNIIDEIATSKEMSTYCALVNWDCSKYCWIVAVSQGEIYFDVETAPHSLTVSTNRDS